jgi:predicted transcriptional regulator of viral defense system
MTFKELLIIVGNEPIFRTSVLLTGQSSASGIRRQLDRWVKAGKIAMLRRGVYAILEPYALKSPHSFKVANALRRASYVSLESALAYYGMIPEYTPVTMSITTGRPETMMNQMGRFVFRHIKKDMFGGFTERMVLPDQKVLIATPDKALVDLLYMVPESDNTDYLNELRLTPVPQLDMDQLTKTVEQCGSGKVERAVGKLKELWKIENEYVSL